jgi:DNA-binding transcriptional MerR regulator
MIAESTALALPGEDHDAFPYRMKDLCERTGMPRQAIHFYIQQGLLPQGKKTGKNMAYYGEEHVRRALLIRKLQHERFLPLKAIKALLDEKEAGFTDSQRDFLDEIRVRLGGRLFGRENRVSSRPVTPLLERCGVTREDFDRLVHMGLLGAGEGEDGETVVADDDAWIIEVWGEVQSIGFSRENGFSVADFALYEEAITGLFKRETEMLKDRLATLDPEVAARMIERAIPILNNFLARYHATLIRNFFTGV